MKSISGERYLVDSNILIYSANDTVAHHAQARAAIEQGLHDGVVFVIAQQNILEFISVMARAYRQPQKQVLAAARAFAEQFSVICPAASTWERCMSLYVKTPSASPYDAYLAATMLDNGVTRIVTENKKDFASFGLEEVVTLREET